MSNYIVPDDADLVFLESTEAAFDLTDLLEVQLPAASIRTDAHRTLEIHMKADSITVPPNGITIKVGSGSMSLDGSGFNISANIATVKAAMVLKFYTDGSKWTGTTLVDGPAPT